MDKYCFYFLGGKTGHDYWFANIDNANLSYDVHKNGIFHKKGKLQRRYEPDVCMNSDAIGATFNLWGVGATVMQLIQNRHLTDEEMLKIVEGE